MTVQGEGSPVKMSVPVCVMAMVLPCMICCARTMSPP
ncbi:Uncharacterised protein [Bordetella pertussis]|nr:Uncharacterised protein [Bordetella pertussis]